MKVVATYFKPDDARYDVDRLLAAYRASAKAHNVPLTIGRISHPTRVGRMRWMDDNSAKLRAWQEAVESTYEPLMLTDIDMVFLQNVDDAFDGVEDLGVTYRTRQDRMPLNGGTFLIRPSERTREMMRRWVEVNDRMMTDHDLHDQWMAKYAGINQAALGYLIENNQLGCNMTRLPCRKWNAVDEDWHDLSETRILHVKGRLRKEVLGIKTNIPFSPEYMPAVRAWQQYDKIAQRQAT